MKQKIFLQRTNHDLFAELNGRVFVVIEQCNLEYLIINLVLV